VTVLPAHGRALARAGIRAREAAVGITLDEPDIIGARVDATQTRD